MNSIAGESKVKREGDDGLREKEEVLEAGETGDGDRRFRDWVGNSRLLRGGRGGGGASRDVREECGEEGIECDDEEGAYTGGGTNDARLGVGRPPMSASRAACKSAA